MVINFWYVLVWNFWYEFFSPAISITVSNPHLLLFSIALIMFREEKYLPHFLIFHPLKIICFYIKRVFTYETLLICWNIKNIFCVEKIMSVWDSILFLISEIYVIVFPFVWFDLWNYFMSWSLLHVVCINCQCTRFWKRCCDVHLFKNDMQKVLDAAHENMSRWGLTHYAS